MANLNSALQQLKDERNHAQAQVEKLNHAIAVIEGLSGRSYTATRGRKRGRRGSLSPAARKRISEAQRARWAARKKGGHGAAPKPAKVSATRKPLSVAGRRKIAAAQRARWARYRSQHKAAA